jgi:hypothetical protein
MAVCAVPFAFYGCTNAGGTSCTKVAVNGYIVNSAVPASCTGSVMISPAEYANFQASIASTVSTFDYVTAAAIFSFFFSFVVGVWYFSKNIGLILNAIRRF